MAHIQSQLPCSVDHVARSGVIDRVVVGAGAGIALHEDLEFTGSARGCSGVARQAQKARVKGGHVAGQHGRRIALGVQGHEQHLHLVGIRAQLLHDLGHGHQGRRADIGALREPEEQHDQLAAKVGQRAGCTRVIGELQRLAVGGARDVGGFKRGRCSGGVGARRLAGLGEPETLAAGHEQTQARDQGDDDPLTQHGAASGRFQGGGCNGHGSVHGSGHSQWSISSAPKSAARYVIEYVKVRRANASEYWRHSRQA